ncbi:protein STAY-GREEN 1, chloroplastic-like isoform X1 [Henckelia pumila]|uniref:protein STAY-GREEN 1, chloroplastic-like isoform X1 n=1 Tax=Henckelia pumila TaxID=405737 RepID=UPI003C6E8A63
MATLTSASIIPSKLKTSSFTLENPSSLRYHRTRRAKMNQYSIVPVARLIGPATFEASKLKVLFLGVDEEEKHPLELPRIYTLTHSDITSKLTLTISHAINNSQLQGWYNKFQRDEVVAEWKKNEGDISLHVHCHISGGHFLLDLCAGLRYFIFSKELPMEKLQFWSCIFVTLRFWSSMFLYFSFSPACSDFLQFRSFFFENANVTLYTSASQQHCIGATSAAHRKKD